MSTLTERILNDAQGLPEGAPLTAKTLLHLGSRAAIDQALSRLVRRGRLLRAGRGLYVRPVEARYGQRAPSADKVVEAIARARGESIASSGAAAANALGLSVQVPMRAIYLTSGPSRQLRLGAQVVELKHAPHWQFVLANQPAGEAIRALGWAGPERADEALQVIKRRLSAPELKALVAARAQLPSWMAERISELATDG
ncbi:MAG: DUF6088 family protein [Lamprobacter sp.]|uniref:DUF6088 family protein n=1 Tax=Lamprobacter sp. TaxID=3100796 RepID=UPI002B262C94|nr:DUF6088 family protein [Lamprobacter sp.]MEA3643016.1 DUF6088 family protein [Lamprobacter sp.]